MVGVGECEYMRKTLELSHAGVNDTAEAVVKEGSPDSASRRVVLKGKDG